ncbi:MAG: hypothetical protein HQM08_04200 [Candidatus Riflebacteria bacterium]|nr:hypothetical protein [Candidatus Riflebacteria bacterium]
MKNAEYQASPENFLSKKIARIVKRFKINGEISNLEKELKEYQKELNYFLFDEFGDLKLISENFAKTFPKSTLKICFQSIKQFQTNAFEPKQEGKMFAEAIFGDEDAIPILSRSFGRFISFKNPWKYSHGAFGKIGLGTNNSQNFFLLVLLKQQQNSKVSNDALKEIFHELNDKSEFVIEKIPLSIQKFKSLPNSIAAFVSDINFQGPFTAASALGMVFRTIRNDRWLIYCAIPKVFKSSTCESLDLLSMTFFIFSFFFWLHFNFQNQPRNISLRFLVPALMCLAVAPAIVFLISLLFRVNDGVSKQRLFSGHRKLEKFLREIDSEFGAHLASKENDLKTFIGICMRCLSRSEPEPALPDSLKKSIMEFAFFDEKESVLYKRRYQEHKLGYIFRQGIKYGASLFGLVYQQSVVKTTSASHSKDILSENGDSFSASTWKLFENYLSNLGHFIPKSTLTEKYLVYSDYFPDPTSNKKFNIAMAVLNLELMKKQYLQKKFKELEKTGIQFVVFRREKRIISEKIIGSFNHLKGVYSLCEECINSEKPVDGILVRGNSSDISLATAMEGNFLDSLLLVAFTPVSKPHELQQDAYIAISIVGFFLFVSAVFLTTVFLKWLYVSLNSIFLAMKKLRNHQIVHVDIVGNDEFGSLARIIERASITFEEVYSAVSMRECFHRKKIPLMPNIQFQEFQVVGGKSGSSATDVFPIGSNCAGFLIVEIPHGKWDKSFILALIKTGIRAIYTNSETSSSDVLKKVLQHVCSIASFPIETEFILGKIETTKREIEYVRKGMFQPIILRFNNSDNQKQKTLEETVLFNEIQFSRGRLTLDIHQGFLAFSRHWCFEKTFKLHSTEAFFQEIFEFSNTSSKMFFTVFSDYLRKSGIEDSFLEDKPMMLFSAIKEK